MNDFSHNYLTFLSHVKTVFLDNNFVESLFNESFEEQITRVKKLDNSLNNTTLFNYLVKNKIKLFSHKEKDTLAVSESLFGSDITLKKIFNNQEDSVKIIFWNDLKKLLVSYYKYSLSLNSDNNIMQSDNNIMQNRMNKLIVENNKNPINEQTMKCPINTKESLNKILKTENLNSTTNEMINDIFSTFEKSMNNSDSNPFENIMQISQIINDKYKSNIENGDINLDDLLKNMTGLPGMENISGLMGSFSNILGKSEPQNTEKIVIDENFTTAIVPKGEEKTETNNLNVNNILKTIDSLGVLGLPNPLNSSTDDNNNGIDKMMNIFNKLRTTTDATDIGNIMESELGIDMNKFTSEMSKVLGDNNDDDEKDITNLIGEND